MGLALADITTQHTIIVVQTVVTGAGLDKLTNGTEQSAQIHNYIRAYSYICMVIYDKGSAAEQRKKNGLLNNGVGEPDFPY